MPEQRCTDAVRRARLVVRHHLDGSAPDALAAVRGVVAMHSSDPATPHLGVQARVHDAVLDDLDLALYQHRALWRLHGMRRTLFVVTADDAPAVQAGAGAEVARAERRRLDRQLAAAGPPFDDPDWLCEVERRTIATLADGAELSTSQFAERVPELAARVTVGSGRWTTEVPLGTRLLSLLALDGHLVRVRPAGSWRSSQYRWAASSRWFGGSPAELGAEEGRAALAVRYLETHGPVTSADLRWWTGWTVTQARAALMAVGAVEVSLDEGATGYLLPDDLPDAVGAPAYDRPAVALLPSLDPTPMGWKDRGWYLGTHAPELFDRNGNVGPTVWVDGRIVGGWAQRPDGEVVTRLLAPVSREASERLEDQAARLTAWLDGVVVKPRFRTPLERALSAP